ncbi:hypothetical protein CsSME_00000763 [Camellia sinensis var. sinensis]
MLNDRDNRPGHCHPIFLLNMLVLWHKVPTLPQPPPLPSSSSSKRRRTHFDLEMARRRRIEIETSSIRMVSQPYLIIVLPPSYNYTKDIIGLVSKTHDQTCTVCLFEFLYGKPVRILPECLHSFHVPCIDM